MAKKIRYTAAERFRAALLRDALEDFRLLAVGGCEAQVAFTNGRLEFTPVAVKSVKPAVWNPAAISALDDICRMGGRWSLAERPAYKHLGFPRLSRFVARCGHPLAIHLRNELAEGFVVAGIGNFMPGDILFLDGNGHLAVKRGR